MGASSSDWSILFSALFMDCLSYRLVGFVIQLDLDSLSLLDINWCNLAPPPLLIGRSFIWLELMNRLTYRLAGRTNRLGSASSFNWCYLAPPPLLVGRSFFQLYSWTV